ncbi:hypothetical protein PMAYCL1PPCAC_11449, partial [Pristionchus mayeri]
FYPHMINRLFVMEAMQLEGIFEKIVNAEEDLKQLKELIIKKFKDTEWLTEEDNLGLSLLPEFEDTIRDMRIFYDLDESDRDLALLRTMNSEFSREYYQARQKRTGTEALDVFIALYAARGSLSKAEDLEVTVLAERVEKSLGNNAYYTYGRNTVTILAPYLYPDPTDSMFNKVFQVFKKHFNKKKLQKSGCFNEGMECLTGHYNRTCKSFGDGTCNSGHQTYEEDGPDVEGLRINYEFFSKHYNKSELQKEVFTSGSVTVNREQAFFYLMPYEFCHTI